MLAGTRPFLNAGSVILPVPLDKLFKAKLFSQRRKDAKIFELIIYFLHTYDIKLQIIGLDALNLSVFAPLREIVFLLLFESIAVSTQRGPDAIGFDLAAHRGAAKISLALMALARGQVAGPGRTMLDFARGRQAETLFCALVGL
jgi:hypothetical protein